MRTTPRPIATGEQTGARLRELRQSWGYDTAADFARTIGYKPSRYQAYERRFPNHHGVFMALFDAMKTVGPFSIDWLFFRKPPWMGSVAARAALRIRNGVPRAKTARLFDQEWQCASLKYQR